MAGVLHTCPASMKAENFHLLSILRTHLRFSIKSSASKNKSENSKPVHHIPESEPPNQGALPGAWGSTLKVHGQLGRGEAHGAPDSPRPPSFCQSALLGALGQRVLGSFLFLEGACDSRGEIRTRLIQGAKP